MADTTGWDRIFEGPLLSASQPEHVEGHQRSSRWMRHQTRIGADKRLDIQGLRMVAVVVVVVNHLTGRLQGGFVGVDVFFVISGYLITGHLLRENEKTRAISLFDFYRRRVRRLFPAALTVIAATIAAGYLIFGVERARSVFVDGVSAAVFSANWRLIHVGTDYFAASGPTSPLQHYWSLSVEEQFYVVWPLLLIGSLAAGKLLARSTRRFGRLPAAIVIGGISAASLVYAAVTPNDVVAYFSTFSRGWELGLGALLALLAPHVRGNTAVMTVLSWAGLMLIAIAVIVVTPAHFPFPSALLPCVGAALVVAASSPTGTAINPLLTNRLSTYLGDISYSIYVVHFPIIIFMIALRSSWNISVYIVTAMLIVGASVLLFHCIENPVRQSDWLRPTRERGENIGSEHGWKHGALLGSTASVGAVAVLVLFTPTGPSSQFLDIQDSLQSAGTSPSTAPSDGATASPAMGPLLTKLQGQLRDALLAEKWPPLSPPPDAARTSDVRGCGAKLEAPPTCTWGNGSRWMYLVGDSTSIAFANAFVGMVPSLPGWHVRAVGGSGCPFASKVLNTDPGNQYAGNCMARNGQIVAEINQNRPSVVVVTAKAGSDDQIAAQNAELQKVQAHVGTFVVLPPNPAGKDPGECYNKVSTPTDCVVKTGAGYIAELAGYRKLASELHAVFIDPTNFFCVNGFCPEFAGHTPIRRDGTHITEAYSKALAPIILEALRERKVFAN